MLTFVRFEVSAVLPLGGTTVFDGVVNEAASRGNRDMPFDGVAEKEGEGRWVEADR